LVLPGPLQGELNEVVGVLGVTGQQPAEAPQAWQQGGKLRAKGRGGGR
jgi:hypothetical protein